MKKFLLAGVLLAVVANGAQVKGQIINPSTTIQLLRVDDATDASELEGHTAANARNRFGVVDSDSDAAWPPLQDNWSTAAPLSSYAAAAGPEALAVIDASCDITHPYSTLNASGGYNSSLYTQGHTWAPNDGDYAEAVTNANSIVNAVFEVVENDEFPAEVLIANAKYVVFDLGDVDCLTSATHNATAGPTSFTSVYLGNGVFQSTAVVANLTGPATTTFDETHFGGIDAQYLSYWEVDNGEIINVTGSSSFGARCDAGSVGGLAGAGLGGGGTPGGGPQLSTMEWWNSVDIDVIVYDDWEDVGMIDP